MEGERGTLIREHNRSVPIRYIAHGQGFGDEPAFVELHELPGDMGEDEIVSITMADGRCLTCQLLYRTNICAVIATL